MKVIPKGGKAKKHDNVLFYSMMYTGPSIDPCQFEREKLYVEDQLSKNAEFILKNQMRLPKFSNSEEAKKKLIEVHKNYRRQLQKIQEIQISLQESNTQTLTSSINNFTSSSSFGSTSSYQSKMSFLLNSHQYIQDEDENLIQIEKDLEIQKKQNELEYNTFLKQLQIKKATLQEKKAIVEKQENTIKQLKLEIQNLTTSHNEKNAQVKALNNNLFRMKKLQKDSCNAIHLFDMI